MSTLPPSTSPEPAPQGRGVHANNLPFVSLFSGIGGLDAGLVAAGGEVVELCESWEPARRVLESRLPGIPLAADVRHFSPSFPHALLAAGFPCVDLSHAGKQAGIFGAQSGLVLEVFRIMREVKPAWVLLENVPNLLRLGRGAGIRLIIDELESLGYHWAYRVLDSRAFGVAQRRHRVIVLASLEPGAAATALIGDDTREFASFDESSPAKASGFYWTEGRRGVGLVSGAVPTLKGGSTVGAPSAPAVWRPGAQAGSRIVLPSIEDAEELQGLKRGWTAPADSDGQQSSRWKLVGNAVTVGLARWVGRRVISVNNGELSAVTVTGHHRNERMPWPDAAFGGPGAAIQTANASKWPTLERSRPLHEVLDNNLLRPLSFRATSGFLSRIEESGIRLQVDFLTDLESHLSYMRTTVSRPTSWASSEAARKRMQSTKQRNTTPEMRLRRALSDRGVRYRLQLRPETDLRWRSDIVFRGPKVLVDVRGCFWHVCPIHRSWPKANAERWKQKLLGNQDRDARMEAELSARGWRVIVVWEHEDAVEASERIESIVRARRTRFSGANLAEVRGVAIA